VDEVVFGRYRLLSVIGRGGMGTVYRAHDTLIGRDVAIKVLPNELGADREYQQRFRREAITAARLNEPHIIPIHDTGEIDGRLYLVMPIVDGVDVQDLLQRDGPMSPERAVHIIEQLASALDAAHAVGLVHRDVKPTNALVTGNDFVYLIDFGIAHDSRATKLTGTGMVVGTFGYMAPERFEDGVIDARSDVYALACVLHECLTGHLPFPGDTLPQQMRAHLSQDPPRPSAERPGIPTGFDDVIARGMAKERDERYQAARDLAAAAHQALSTSPSRAAQTAVRARAVPTQPPRAAGLLDGQTPAATRHHAADAPTGPEPTAPAPRRDAAPRRLLRAGPIALVVVAVAAVTAIVVGIAGYLSRSPAPPTPAAQSAMPSGPTVAPVEQTALQGLLLSPEQLNTAMGTTGMTVTGTVSALPDAGGQVPDKACVPLEGPGQALAYAGSGFTAVSGQRAADQSHGVEQIVVSFSSAQAARAFFAASAQRWPACANRQHDETTTAGQTQVHTVGQVSDINGTLSATITGVVGKTGASGACERALTVANNVAIDIDACSASPSGAAVNIADQIAAKVPTG
jgi:hypothetical protein